MFSDRTSCLGGALVVVLEVDVDDVVVVELDSRLQGLNLCGKLLLYDSFLFLPPILNVGFFLSFFSVIDSSVGKSLQLLLGNLDRVDVTVEVDVSAK